MLQRVTILVLLCAGRSASAATIQVPQDHKTIQAAIHAARPGDTVLVAAGRYRERIRLGPGIIVRSVGDDAKGKIGLKRAEETILDGGGENGHGENGGGENGGDPGVAMAAGSTLDGLTVTNVGGYDEAVWRKHFESHGEELADDQGAVRAEGTVAAISIRFVDCSATNNIVHHNGDVGIAVIGDEGRRVAPVVSGNVSFRNLGGGIGVADRASPVVRDNVCYENLRGGIGCRNSSPLILDNVCYGNIRAGIGCREGATPVVRGNKCYRNRRAGIGIRMKGTAPVVEGNECYENEMAGIGCRDGAEPIIRNNLCRDNKLAGIGCDGASPLIVANECRQNAAAGIGVRGNGNATIVANKCHENKLVAIGITDGSTATIHGNQLERTGGVPPIVAVKDGSTARIYDNKISGGGVAAVLVQGTATIGSNEFVGQGERQGNAVWVWEGSIASIDANRFDGYRAAVSATKATVVVSGNTASGTTGAAFVVKDSVRPPHVYGNTVIAPNDKIKAVEIIGAAGIVADNVVTQQADE